MSLTALLGRIDLVDNFLYRGHELRGVAITSSKRLGSARDFSALYLAYRGFVPVVGDLEAGLRLTAAHVIGGTAVDDWKLGGQNLDPFVHGERNPGILSVRGLRPTQMMGDELVFANFEPRFTVLRDQSLPLIGGASLQVAAFVDAGRAFDDLPLSRPAVIAGGGMLITLLEFRYTYLNWYVAHAFAPYEETSFAVALTRPFF